MYFKEQSFEFQFDADNDEETLRNFDTALKTVFEERSSDLMKMLLDRYNSSSMRYARDVDQRRHQDHLFDATVSVQYVLVMLPTSMLEHTKSTKI